MTGSYELCNRDGKRFRPVSFTLRWGRIDALANDMTLVWRRCAYESKPGSDGATNCITK